MDILLTNDDGIDSAGIRALYEALSDIGDVLTVAPAADQSAVGRVLSDEVRVKEHELGFAIDGTPADCVIAGLEAIGPYPDIVVAGCNEGANLGAYVLGRSGTVSAAVEAAFFDVPAIAVSVYLPKGEYPREVAPEEFRHAAAATRYLTDHAEAAGVFDVAEYLNVNAPLASPGDDPAPLAVTRPSHTHAMDAERNGEGTITLYDRIWDMMADGSLEESVETDRGAVLDGRVSVSPLTAPHTTERHEALDALVETYDPA